MQTVQSFTHEVEDRRVYAEAVENSFNTAKLRILARSGMTAIAIVLVFAVWWVFYGSARKMLCRAP